MVGSRIELRSNGRLRSTNKITNQRSIERSRRGIALSRSYLCSTINGGAARFMSRCIDGRVFDVSEAVRTARAWMKRRVEAGQPALCGMFTRAEVTYAWPRPDGTIGSDREPVALFTGEAVHAYPGQLSDATIEAMLNELSIELGAALGQERIYVAFANRTWILDAGEREK